MLKLDDSEDLYEQFNRLIEENKLDSKYAEIANLITYILIFTMFIILNQFISNIESLTISCTFYLVAKTLIFIMFGSRNKRRKRKLLIKSYLNSIE